MNLKALLAAACISTFSLAGAVGCGSSDTTDTSNGKTISQLKLNGDTTLDSGSTLQLTVTAQYADGTSADVTAASTFDTSDASVATVDKNGLVTGVKAGEVDLDATYMAAKDTHHLIVH